MSAAAAVQSLRVDLPSGGAQPGFWGVATSTIDWCEGNYEHSFYVAEFWNTVSNLLFVLVGLYGLAQSMKQGFEWRFHLQFIGIMVTGFGSAMFHGTLQHVYQQCDETPMIWAMLTWIYIVYNNEIEQLRVPNSAVIAFLVFVGVAFAVVHSIYRFTTFFQIFFGVLSVCCAVRLGIHYNQVHNPRALALARSYIYFSLIGFAFWLVDYHCCHVMRELPVNPQGHAWWHIFMGLSTYHGPIFMQYVRMEQLQKKVEIRDTMFGIQTIVVATDELSDAKKPKTL